jgi:hypothetical protein
MGKLKEKTCMICGKRINRHDPKRVNYRVGINAHKEAHLSCSPEGN